MKPSIHSLWTQTFPPKPAFTEKNLPDLKDKVYIVSGSNTGLGKELARMLYSKNAKVYIAARSRPKAEKAIGDIKRAAPASTGALVFMPLDLSDLTTIKASVQQFLSAESKLHVLFNNAGVMTPSSAPTKTAQGYELHLGVNCVGTFLFTKLLTPILISTARTEPPNTVRVVWVSSHATEMFATDGVGLPTDNLDYHIEKSGNEKYSLSKTGNWSQGVEFAKRHKADGIISIPLNPGNLTSELFREQNILFRSFVKLIAYPPLYGACTQLFAGLSPEVTIDKSGSWVVPFGRIYPIRKDLERASKTVAEGGTGGTHAFWEWNEEQVRPYL